MKTLTKFLLAGAAGYFMGVLYDHHPYAVCVVGAFGVGYMISDIVERLST